MKCIYTIHPKSDLLEKAAKCIGNFVLSQKINLKYLGMIQKKVSDISFLSFLQSRLQIFTVSNLCSFAAAIGLKALTYVVQQDPKLALQHQMTIIECLDHPDLIIKREVRH